MYVLNIAMDDAPHITPEMIEEELKDKPAWEINARRYGIPHLGSGAVFKTPLTKLDCIPFSIPDHWKIAIGLDVGITAEHYTAAIFVAKNPETGCYYIFDEYYECYEKPFVHAQAILSRGINPPGAIDYSANARMGTRDELVSTRALYEDAGLTRLENADKRVTPGLQKMWTLMSQGMLKVFPQCHNWRKEFVMYCYENGKIKKKNDDCMDATRYAILKFDDIAMPKFQCARNFNLDDYFDNLRNEYGNNNDADEIGGY